MFAEQIIYIVNHAEDKYLFVDLAFVPFVEKLFDQLPKVKGYVIMTDEAHMPKATLPNVICYETLLAPADDGYQKVINCRQLKNNYPADKREHPATK